MKKLIKNISNIPGWRTNRKIIVFESDDWGSMRMPSLETYQTLQRGNIQFQTGISGRYNRYDSLENSSDLAELFEILLKHQDFKGNSACFTAMCLMANPDFEQIKASNFTKYFLETVDQSFVNEHKGEAINLWREGDKNGIFNVEFHGREHLNVAAWMRSLQQNDAETHIAFKNRLWGIPRKKGVNFQAAFDLEELKEVEPQKQILIDGLQLFETLMKRKAVYFVPPNGPIHEQIEETALQYGINYLSTSKIHHMPLGNGAYRKQFRYLGKRRKSGLTYLTRNAFFEPCESNRDEISGCLSEIELAFKWKKPAVISTHRVNYISSIHPQNGQSGLEALDKLLKKIVMRWPDVEFMSSVQLGQLMTGQDV